jgi:hypothetical protein
VRKLELHSPRGVDFDLRALNVRVRSEGPHLGIASAEPKAGVRRSRTAAMLELAL